LNLRLVSPRDDQVPGSQDILLANPDVQVTEHSECKVPVDRGSQDRSFERDGRDAMPRKQIQKPEQLPGQEKIALGIGVKMISKVGQDSLRHTFRADGIQVPVQERHDSPPGRSVQ